MFISEVIRVHCCILIFFVFVLWLVGNSLDYTLYKNNFITFFTIIYFETKCSFKLRVYNIFIFQFRFHLFIIFLLFFFFSVLKWRGVTYKTWLFKQLLKHHLWMTDGKSTELVFISITNLVSGVSMPPPWSTKLVNGRKLDGAYRHTENALLLHLLIICKSFFFFFKIQHV